MLNRFITSGIFVVFFAACSDGTSFKAKELVVNKAEKQEGSLRSEESRKVQGNRIGEKNSDYQVEVDYGTNSDSEIASDVAFDGENKAGSEYDGAKAFNSSFDKDFDANITNADHDFDADEASFGCEMVSHNRYLFYKEYNPDIYAGARQSLDHCNNADGKTCMLSGFAFREDRNLAVFIIKGKTKHGWQIRIAGTRNENLPQVTVYSSEVHQDRDVFIVPFEKIIPSNDWRDGSVQFEVKAVDQSGKQLGAECKYETPIKSPLVLTFGEKLDHYGTVESKVFFDFDGDGRKEHTGWVGPNVAFLVLDKNSNGMIDSGLELFGTNTLINEKFFSNGFIALSQYDKSNDGLISEKDPIFTQIKLWFDRNQDGLSQPQELSLLKDHKINGIDLNYKEINSPRHSPFENLIPFQSKFYGPDVCGENGCSIYDIFFSTTKDY